MLQKSVITIKPHSIYVSGFCVIRSKTKNLLEMLERLLDAVLVVETEAADVDSISAETVLSKHIANEKQNIQKDFKSYLNQNKWNRRGQNS